ncbi:phage regulatory CII family protein [Shewanella algae]|uniref:phage regulatory CII family protein n=1 Tax=Shewanella algae TaxID=38313 RepID=UPI0031F5701C
MYATTTVTHKAGQPHIAGALRQFANSENLTDIACRSNMRPQVLRNKLLLDQPHLLSIHELVKVTLASGNRAIVDGILLELDCAPSMPIEQMADDGETSLTDRALEIITNSAQLGSIAQDAKARRGVTERMRHEAVRRATRVMGELALFVHEVEERFQAIPVLSIAADVVQTMPTPGIA